MPQNKPEPIIAQKVSARKVSPDELSDGFHHLGISAGDSIMLHASLDRIGDVDGGAAMVLHRLLGAIGKKGTLLMPTFTSITRHSSTHDNFTKPGCWCEGSETRHLPFIPDLQPDKTVGAIAQRLCSWPSSRRSNHLAYSFVAVGAGGDELVHEYDLLGPLLPIKRFLKHDPIVLTIGVLFDSVTAIHLAEERKTRSKFAMERALTMSSKRPCLGRCARVEMQQRLREAQIEYAGRRTQGDDNWIGRGASVFYERNCRDGAGASRQGPMCAFLRQYGMSQPPKVGLARFWREQLLAPPTKFFRQ